MAFQALPAADSSLVEDVWEMLLEEGVAAAGAAGTGAKPDASAAGASAGTTEPMSMAQLLFGVVDPSPQECYQAFRLLEGAQGALRFKRLWDGHYEARTRYVGGYADRVVSVLMSDI